MDWISENKYKNLLIVVLLGLNILTVSTIWIQTARPPEQQRPPEAQRGPQSLELMRKAIGLNEEQVHQLSTKRTANADQVKELNDRLDSLKGSLIEVLMKDQSDTKQAQELADQIGSMQARVEIARVEYLRDLLSICTPEQKERLKPILTEILTKQQPKNRSEEAKRQPPKPEVGRKKEAANNQDAMDKRPRRNVDRTSPPPPQEKLAKYAERLSLSESQKEQLKEILAQSRKQGSEDRRSGIPEKLTKEQKREKEDQRIMQILNEDQKKEFVKMISKRQ